MFALALIFKESLVPRASAKVECHVNSTDLRPVVQSVASSIADPGVVSLILARSHTSVEIGCEIFSTGVLLFLLIQEGLVSVTSEIMYTKYWLTA